ncbi:hypothetical protein D2M30_3910 [Bacillus amyloliquefaciens]|nr:hypothetical protein D2M30_3910 [Bacillus amyloliquefaciens]
MYIASPDSEGVNDHEEKENESVVQEIKLFFSYRTSFK